MRSLTPRRWALALALVLSAAVGTVSGFAADADDEAAIMAQEEKAEEELPLDKKPPGSLLGRVQLQNAPDDAENGVVGHFIVGTRGYLLRLARPEVWEQLRKHNGETVTLFGKVRMRGKYFIAEGLQISTPGVKRSDRSRRSGM